MTAIPDADVVTTREEASRQQHPPLLIVDSLTDYLDAVGLGEGALSWERIGNGQSNVTYLIGRGPARYVVRRGPRPPHPRSTHDMTREARFQRFVAGYGFPVPEILAVCDDPDILGVPFYVMQHLDGLVITDEIPSQLDGLDRRRSASEALVDLLVDLHRVPVDSPAALGLGRPDGYLRRQVERFASLWDGGAERELPAVGELATWLADNCPSSPAATVVHGDFRMGNVMYRPGSTADVLALLDWEMATLGDPLADLGYLVATYAEPGSSQSIMELTSVTSAPGFLTRRGIVDRYVERTGRDTSALAWYEALALWKAAIFCEAIYSRWQHGERPADTEFGPKLRDGVPQLLQLALAAAHRTP